MFIKRHIGRYERGLLFRRGDFVRPITGASTYRLWIWNWRRDRLQIVDTTKTKFEHAQLDLLVRDDRLREQLIVLDLTDAQRALVWKDGRLLSIVGPGRHAFWKTPFQIHVPFEPLPVAK